MTKIIVNAKQMQSKSKTHLVEKISPNGYNVTSGKSGQQYRVVVLPHGATCTCKWGAHRPQDDHRAACSHVVAVYRHLEATEGRTLSVWTNQDDVARQKKAALNIGDGVTLTLRNAPAKVNEANLLAELGF